MHNIQAWLRLLLTTEAGFVQREGQEQIFGGSIAPQSLAAAAALELELVLELSSRTLVVGRAQSRIVVVSGCPIGLGSEKSAAALLKVLRVHCVR